jgi:hypothetical protein
MLVGVVAAVLAATAILLAIGNHVSDTTGARMLEGSGIAATQTRELPPFDAVELAGSNTVAISVGGKQSVVVHADDNLLDRVTTRVKGGKLVIGNAAGGFSTKGPMSVEVTVPAVNELTLGGSGTIRAEGVDADVLTVELYGSGGVRASGRAHRVDVRLAGSGDVQLRELVADDVKAIVNGTGSVAVHATESVDASVPGTGSIVYAGNPARVRKSVTGIGSVTGR